MSTSYVSVWMSLWDRCVYVHLCLCIHQSACVYDDDDMSQEKHTFITQHNNLLSFYLSVLSLPSRPLVWVTQIFKQKPAPLCLLFIFESSAESILRFSNVVLFQRTGLSFSQLVDSNVFLFVCSRPLILYNLRIIHSTELRSWKIIKKLKKRWNYYRWHINEGIVLGTQFYDIV